MREITVEESKKIGLEILLAFHNYCIEHNLKYTLFYGTMLGAIRHKGYIPWDDDIDVAMPREDYDYFINNFDTERYGVMTPYNNKYYFLPSAKVYDKRTRKIENIHISNKFAIGMDIDVFPLDYCSSESQYLKIQKKKKIWMKIKMLSFYPESDTKNWLKKIIVFFFRPFGNSAVKRIDKIGRIYNKDNHHYLIANPMFGDEKLLFNSHLFDNLEFVEFENLHLCISSLYDEVLTQRYGAYMIPPNIKERVTHHNYKAYYLDNN